MMYAKTKVLVYHQVYTHNIAKFIAILVPFEHSKSIACHSSQPRTMHLDEFLHTLDKFYLNPPHSCPTILL